MQNAVNVVVALVDELGGWHTVLLKAITMAEAKPTPARWKRVTRARVRCGLLNRAIFDTIGEPDLNEGPEPQRDDEDEEEEL
jgi:hypothetical protein